MGHLRQCVLNCRSGIVRHSRVRAGSGDGEARAVKLQVSVMARIAMTIERLVRTVRAWKMIFPYAVAFSRQQPETQADVEQLRSWPSTIQPDIALVETQVARLVEDSAQAEGDAAEAAQMAAVLFSDVLRQVHRLLPSRGSVVMSLDAVRRTARLTYKAIEETEGTLPWRLVYEQPKKPKTVRRFFVWLVKDSWRPRAAGEG